MIYVYVCPSCGISEARSCSVADRDKNLPVCFNCDKPMPIEIQPVAGVVKNPAVPRKVLRS